MTPILRAILPPLLAASLTGCCCATGPLDTAGDDPRLDLQPATSTAESDAAAPPWAQDHRKAAPQTPDAERIFDDLTLATRIAALDRDLILCRITSTADTDAGQPPDLTLQIAIGDRKATVLGPDDASTLTFSVPLVTMKRGDTLTIDAFDRDPTTTEPAGSLQDTFAGVPFETQGQDLSMACRALKRIEVERDMILAWRRFEATAQDMGTTLIPNPKTPDWGRGDTHLDELEQDIEAMAALVGWSDTRVQTKLAALKKSQDRWDALVATSIAAFNAENTPTTRATLPDEGLKLDLKTLACSGHKHLESFRNNAPNELRKSAADAACLIMVDVTNTGIRPIRGLGLTGRLGDLADISMVSPTGATIPAAFYPLLDGGKAADFTLNPDTTQAIVLVPRNNAGEPTLLRLKSRRGLVWMSTKTTGK